MIHRRHLFHACVLSVGAGSPLLGAGPAHAQPVPAAVAATTSTSVAAAGVGAGTLFATDAPVFLQTPAPPGSVSSFSTIRLPAQAPAYLSAFYQSALKAPLPLLIYAQGGIPASVPQSEWDVDAAGLTATYQPGGAVTTKTNAFFQSLGSNGRACITCHQPPNGMSVSAAFIQARYMLSRGTDPIFAPVDGANCPSAVSSASTSGSLLGRVLGKGVGSFVSAHSLLLTRGLFRIFLPVPKNAEFTVTVVHDPNGCNTDPTYNTVVDADGTSSQIVSVYRRPRMTANLNVLTQPYSVPGKVAVFPGNTLPGIDPHTGYTESGNIMWDGREPTLESQAVDATLGHAQALTAPTAAQVAQMVAFEKGIFTAQTFIAGGGWLQLNGGKGGAADLSAISLVPTTSGPPAPPTAGEPMDLFTAMDTGNAARASIARGAVIFNSRTFTAANVSGFDFFQPVNGGVSVTCSTCHDGHNSGSSAPTQSQQNTGIGGASLGFGGPAPDPALPIFRVTCKAGAATSFQGPTMLTNDLGRAMISGKCADVGLVTVPQLRGLASQAPYFHDGSAAGLADVVKFYNTRFNIGLSAQEAADLTNFLNAL